MILIYNVVILFYFYHLVGVTKMSFILDGLKYT